MIARSLDIYALAKLTLEEGIRPYAIVAGELEMSASEFHAAVHRLGQAGLVAPKDRRVRQGAVREFLIHGLRYFFPAAMGGLTRGMHVNNARNTFALRTHLFRQLKCCRIRKGNLI